MSETQNELRVKVAELRGWRETRSSQSAPLMTKEGEREWKPCPICGNISPGEGAIMWEEIKKLRSEVILFEKSGEYVRQAQEHAEQSERTLSALQERLKEADRKCVCPSPQDFGHEPGCCQLARAKVVRNAIEAAWQDVRERIISFDSFHEALKPHLDKVLAGHIQAVTDAMSLFNELQSANNLTLAELESLKADYIEMEERQPHTLIDQLIEQGGAIVSTNDCSEMEIAYAKVDGRFGHVAAMGLVRRTKEWLALQKSREAKPKREGDSVPSDFHQK